LVSAPLQKKPSPNESTTPVLSARGARRTVLDPGPLGSAVRVSTVWIGLSNPHQKKQTVSKDKIFLNLDKFNLGDKIGDNLIIKLIYIIKSIP